MPLPTFLFLILSVIVTAGLSIALAHTAGLSMTWLSVVGLFAALGLRGLKWL